MHAACTPRFATITLAPATDCTVRVKGPLALDSVQQLQTEYIVPGGKGLNVARTLATQGLPVLATGLIGHDAQAAYDMCCRDHRIEPGFLGVEAPTRTNLMLTDGIHELKINRAAFPDLTLEEAWLTEMLTRIEAFATTHLVASGSLPAGFPADTYARLAHMATGAGIRVALDTSGAALAAVTEASPWVVKPNREEAEALVGRALGKERGCIECIQWLATRAQYAILSDGAAGAWFGTGSEVWHVPSPVAATVDTTGAGDILLAVFCAHVATAGFGPEAMCLAVAAGAAETEQVGPQPPPSERVQELAKTIAPRALH